MSLSDGQISPSLPSDFLWYVLLPCASTRPQTLLLSHRLLVCQMMCGHTLPCVPPSVRYHHSHCAHTLMLHPLDLCHARVRVNTPRFHLHTSEPLACLIWCYYTLQCVPHPVCCRHVHLHVFHSLWISAMVEYVSMLIPPLQEPMAAPEFPTCHRVPAHAPYSSSPLALWHARVCVDKLDITYHYWCAAAICTGIHRHMTPPSQAGPQSRHRTLCPHT